MPTRCAKDWITAGSPRSSFCATGSWPGARAPGTRSACSPRRRSCWPAEAPHLARAQVGMVAAAALGDVVEQRRRVQDPGLVPAGGQLRAERVLGACSAEEAPHVAQHPSGCAGPPCTRGTGRAASGRRCAGTPTGSARAPRSGSSAHGVHCRAAASAWRGRSRGRGRCGSCVHHLARRQRRRGRQALDAGRPYSRKVSRIARGFR